MKIDALEALTNAIIGLCVSWAATVLAAGVHVNALRAALVQLGRDADAEIKAAIGAKE